MTVSASYFLENNLSVFECSANRRPKASGWRDLEYWMIDGDDANRWSCYAVALEAEWLVIDVDLRKPEAHDSFTKLSAFVDFSDCFTCKTARGGYHYWFRNPTQQPIRKNLPQYPGIDFLSEKSYVIGPNSIAETGEYHYQQGELSTSPEAPIKLLEELQNDIKVEKLDASPIKINESLERSRFKQWIMAQAPAVQGENGNDYTYNTAAYGFDFGLSKEDILEVMLEWDQKNSPSWGEQELSTIIGNAAKYAQNAKGKAAINFEVFTSNKPLAESVYKPGVYDDAFYAKLHPGTALTYRGDHILPTASNLRIVLLADRYKGLFLWDTFRKKIALSNRPLWRGNKADGSLTMSDMDWRELRVDLSITAKMDCPTLLLEDAVYSLAIARSFNPICDWLNGLQWDGKPRIGMLFGYGYYRLTVAQIFLLASIYRIFYPGYKFDHMLVIAGAQGLGKSYLIEAIGGEFAKVAKKIPTDSRSVQEIEGAWWLEFPELTSVNKVDINQIKAFITCTKDTYIPMYGKHGPQDFPRVCIPVWTINPTVAGFITDDENRRFLIIDQTEKIPVDYIKANRDQIFAEAMELYRNGVRPHKLVETIKDHAEEKAQINKDSDVWEDLISDWLIKGNKENATVTTREVYFDALSIYSVESWDKRSQQRIAKCLRQLGWVKKKSSGATFFVKNDEEDIDIEEDV